MTASVHPKEKLLRGAIVATPLLSIPILPAAFFGIHVLWVVFTVLASTTGGFVLLFYALWTVAVLEGRSPSFNHPELIGDDTCYPPPLYWVFGRRQRHIRRARRIRAMERECGIRDAYPIGLER